MPQERIYLDHNATSPLRPEAHDAMLEAMALDGNPSSVHAEGRAAKAVLERARKQVASLVGAEPEQVVFTSGGTEANAMVFRPWFFDERWDDLGDFAGPVAFVAEFEHPSVLDGLNASSLAFFYEERLPISDDGVVGVGQAVKAIDDVLAKTQVMTDTGETDPTPHRSFAATLMMANNETGVIQPAVEFAEHVRDRPGWFHCDAVQAIGKVSVDFATSSFATMSASSHKLGGPKGVGALVFRGNDVLVDEPMMRGGGQEKRMRAGTENLIGIAGFGAAAEAAKRDLDDFAKLADWRDELEAAVLRHTPDAVVIAQSSPRLPNTSCIALPGVPAETLVMALDLEGVAVSAGSACSSGKVTRSRVLEAMGLDDDISSSAIRVSLGWNSSKKHVDHFLKAWTTVTDRLARN